MISLLSYLHACYIKSYRFGPPTLVFYVVILLMYSVKPNYIMDSYALSNVFIFIISASVSYSFIDLENSNQESITLMHCNSLLKLYAMKVLYCWLFTVPMAFFAVFYPMIIDAFVRIPTVEEGSVALFYHFISSIVGVMVGCWFNAKFIHSRLMSFLSLTIVIIITMSAEGIKEQLPSFLSKLTLLLPPISDIIYLFSNYESSTPFMKWYPLVISLIYVSIIGVLFYLLLNKRKINN